MALLASESRSRGFVFTATGALSVTYSTAGATNYEGFLRDTDGRLVIVNG